MRAWTVDIYNVGKLGVAMTGLHLPKGVSIEEALIKVREVGGVLAVQLFDWRRVVGPVHLLQASVLAYKAFKEGRMLSRSLSMEVMLYAAGERQIKDAIAKLGGREDRVVALCLAPNEEEAVRGLTKAIEVLGASEDEKLVEMEESKVGEVTRAFEISDEEVEASIKEGEGVVQALIKCVLSRVAELDVKKEG
ncbi:MAG: KEOPS complex subunit Cgi121 [Candidatus Nezhaarchaeales archaeon]